MVEELLLDPSVSWWKITRYTFGVEKAIGLMIVMMISHLCEIGMFIYLPWVMLSRIEIELVHVESLPCIDQ